MQPDDLRVYTIPYQIKRLVFLKKKNAELLSAMFFPYCQDNKKIKKIHAVNNHRNNFDLHIKKKQYLCV
jgi:hypothetical protein